ncbi:MAG: CoA transferase, partial [Oscillospiraceae bacterium]|nr:CoA transferase [Oscillospiraceae bacterium]
MSAMKPLEGIKVIEQSVMVASACAGRMMADFGAEVIKVEDARGGDPMRKWAAGIGAPIDELCNPIFDNLNANKQGLSIDLKSEEGREVFYKLLENADVFLTNNRTEALERMGLDYATLHAKFPKLVVTQLEGYGAQGPEACRPGSDSAAF